MDFHLVGILAGAIALVGIAVVAGLAVIAGSRSPY